MTQDKALKAAIRARMAQSHEPYSVARHSILADRSAGGERAVTDDALDPDADQDLREDYYARYLHEAEEAGASAEELQGMSAEGRLRDLADSRRAAADKTQEAADKAQAAADQAEELAEQAEEAADQAEERAEMAQEAAELAQEWADAQEQDAAQQRADRMRERADQARELAERAREQADRAQERADLAQEAACEAWDDDGYDVDLDDSDDAQRGAWPGATRLLHPPRPPRPPRAPSMGPGERLMSRLEELEQRFEQMQDRAVSFLDRLRLDRNPD